MGPKTCPEEAAMRRVERIADSYRALCSCGWASKFFPSEKLATAAWGIHLGRRSTDPWPRLPRDRGAVFVDAGIEHS